MIDIEEFIRGQKQTPNYEDYAGTLFEFGI